MKVGRWCSYLIDWVQELKENKLGVQVSEFFFPFPLEQEFLAFIQITALSVGKQAENLWHE